MYSYYKVESEKVGLKLNIQKTKIMASSPITSWEIDGETVADFIFLGSKITADGDCIEYPIDRGVWRITVHGVAKSQTRLKRLSMRTC